MQITPITEVEITMNSSHLQLAGTALVSWGQVFGDWNPSYSNWILRAKNLGPTKKQVSLDVHPSKDWRSVLLHYGWQTPLVTPLQIVTIWGSITCTGHFRNLKSTTYKAYFSGLCKGICPQIHGLIWYSTSILGSWNSH